MFDHLIFQNISLKIFFKKFYTKFVMKKKIYGIINKKIFLKSFKCIRKVMR